MIKSQSLKLFFTASNISFVLVIFIFFTLLLIVSLSMLDTNITSAPLLAHSFAREIPIFPVEGLVKHLNGSMNSFVGPAVTRTFLPFKSCSTS